MTSTPFILALDIDGTSGDYEDGLRQVVAKMTGVPAAEIGPATDWSFVKSGWPLRDERHFLEAHATAVSEGLFRTMKPYDGMSQALWDLSDAGVYVRVLTNRLIVKGHHIQALADTAAWLDVLDGPERDGVPAQRVPYRDLCFAADKARVDADAYIDDAPHNIEALHAAGKTVIVMHQRYNAHIEVPDRMRVRNWQEAKELILELQAERDSALAA